MSLVIELAVIGGTILGIGILVMIDGQLSDRREKTHEVRMAELEHTQRVDTELLVDADSEPSDVVDGDGGDDPGEAVDEFVHRHGFLSPAEIDVEKYAAASGEKTEKCEVCGELQPPENTTRVTLGPPMVRSSGIAPEPFKTVTVCDRSACRQQAKAMTP